MKKVAAHLNKNGHKNVFSKQVLWKLLGRSELGANCFLETCFDPRVYFFIHFLACYICSCPKVFYKKDVKIFAKFTRKHLCRSLIFNKVATLFERKLQHSYYSVNFVKNLWTPLTLLIERLPWLRLVLNFSKKFTFLCMRFTLNLLFCQCFFPTCIFMILICRLRDKNYLRYLNTGNGEIQETVTIVRPRLAWRVFQRCSIKSCY